MVPSPRKLLGHIHGGRVLDLATGAGGFIPFLDDGLADRNEIIGIDSDGSKADAFAEATRDRPRVRFEVRDAAATGFPDASFGTVSVAHSLHHFADPVAALREALRVLRPGGWLIVFEMYRDHQEPPQATHVELHHWWATIDRAHGITHRATYPRRELLGLVEPLALDDLRVSEVSYPEDDPLDPDSLAEMDEAIDRHLARTTDDPALTARGEALRRRLHEVGIRGASSICAVGRKPG